MTDAYAAADEAIKNKRFIAMDEPITISTEVDPDYRDEEAGACTEPDTEEMAEEEDK